jgi:ABC-type glycerol-3-phosphate transport system substrate-binding protein
LTRNNLDAWIPYTQITDVNSANTGVGNLNLFPTLLMQNGLSMYNEDLTATSFTDPDVISVFSDWTDYYTKLKLPYQLDFFTRFRLGTCPIGIAPYTTYNTLRDSAKEIDGKWAMAQIPGTRQADGTINHSSSGSGTACSILAGAKDPEAAWTFLKWWTEAETQLKYSNSLEAILGPVGRVAVANMEALQSMAWDVESLKVINTAWNDVREIREVPGSYYVARSLDFAFWNVASMSKNPKDMMQTWGEEADAEIKRKLEQYENR